MYYCKAIFFAHLPVIISVSAISFYSLHFKDRKLIIKHRQTFQNRCDYVSIDRGDFVSKYMASISFNVQYYNKAYFEQHKKL